MSNKYSEAGLISDLNSKIATLQAENAALKSELARANLAVAAVSALIGESFGVCGLHLNGDDAQWESLLRGGHFEDWLKPYSDYIDPLEREIAQQGEEG